MSGIIERTFTKGEDFKDFLLREGIPFITSTSDSYEKFGEQSYHTQSFFLADKNIYLNFSSYYFNGSELPTTIADVHFNIDGSEERENYNIHFGKEGNELKAKLEGRPVNGDPTTTLTLLIKSHSPFTNESKNATISIFFPYDGEPVCQVSGGVER